AWPTERPCRAWPARLAGNGALCASGRTGSCAGDCVGSPTRRAAGVRPAFPPRVATHLVKLACELPDSVGRSLSTWTCAELARTLKETGVVDEISPQSVQRILFSYKLKPWRVHYWLTPK